MTANNSNLHTLLEAWGVNFNANQVLLDAMNGLDIRTQAGGVTRHFGFVGLSADHLDSQDITTANLELINGASFGVLSASDDANTQLLPLLTSSVNTDLIDANEYAQTRDADALSQAYQSQNTVFVLAARLSGQVNSAFSQAPEGSESQQHTESSDKLNVMLIADTDLLADRFWVQQSNFFGQVITTPFANNGDFVTNAVENLGGSEALISIRSRGTFARPFTKVDQLTVIAEQKFREQEQVLQQQLDETEQQLMQLQGQQGEDGALVINPQQQQAIDEFMNKRIEIRKSLREVRHQLDKDIESLGNKLKVLNIAIAPLVLIFLLVILRALFRTKPKKVATSQQAASEQQGAS
jgi:ABC-type uncharacterized transport system involved in gliding motility auxiliary subunit